jgi:predicted enzyme related to lactoylglutathione lyase
VEAVSGQHNVGHFEIPADDVVSLKNFYSSLFAWQFEEGETRNYMMIKNAGISGGLAPKQDPEQMPTFFVNVEWIDEYVDKAKKLGAKVAKDKKEIEQGYFAVLEDPQQNTFGIWQEK